MIDSLFERPSARLRLQLCIDRNHLRLVQICHCINVETFKGIQFRWVRTRVRAANVNWYRVRLA